MAVILTEDEAKALLQKVLKFSKADECEINISGEKSGNLRYARNEVSTSGSQLTQNLIVQSAFGKKVGVATTNEFSEEAFEKVVRQSEELAQLAPENPEYVGVLTPQQYKKTSGFFDSTANITPDFRAGAVAKSLELSRTQNLAAAGFWEDQHGYSAMMNSKQLFAYYPSTNVNFSLTVRTPDGTGSGYVARGYSDVTKLDIEAATKTAIRKSTGSLGAKALEPGKYTVILEPTAAAVLLENIFFNIDARSADEGRSFLSKQGGKTKLGEKIVDERINIYSDPAHPDLPSSPWAGDGQPMEKVNWIEKGVVKNMAYSRFWAQKKGVKPVPFPNNMVVAGGTATLEEMIASTKQGILVTKLWYIREVDPQTLLLTGLTRDGTFYIENGKIKHPVKNFRFNESPVIMLNNLETLGKSERVVSTETNRNYLIPPMKIREFTFSSLSDAV
ncbi:Predicted Zn-dependent protease or its inactivated homolog [Dyadobacter koreensis]|uniref:Predicted Zn-dependent protease or its inactivated homolog n=1 Tax=Dyadobacter koreensis TaxID=408657 RepID=A0A1H6XW44_9BACT|nr:TldD/PmbA family protein [Dyadobacter koreensis]SEJ30977.1 Predicted Zn-dependent protease or its inactivated homolog [Dyadobacter koreensis]